MKLYDVELTINGLTLFAPVVELFVPSDDSPVFDLAAPGGPEWPGPSPSPETSDSIVEDYLGSDPIPK